MKLIYLIVIPTISCLIAIHAHSQEISLVMGPNDPLLALPNVYTGDLKLDPSGNLYQSSSSSILKTLPNGTSSLVLRTAVTTNSVILGSSNSPAQDIQGNQITLQTISDIAFDNEGAIYVGGRDSNNVVKINRDGSIQQIVSESGDGQGHSLLKPTNIAVDSLGNVYVIGSESENIFLVSPSGEVSEILNRQGTGESLFIPQGGIVFDSQNTAYISSRRAFFMRSANGSITEILKPNDFPSLLYGGSLSPASLTIDTLGNLYFTRSSASGVFRFTQLGELQIVINAAGDGTGDQECYQAGPFGLTECETWGNYLGGVDGLFVDSNFNVFASSGASRNIYKIDVRGHISELIDIDEITGFQVSDMTSAIMDNSGNFYFRSFRANSVFRLAPLPVQRSNLFATDPPHSNVIHDENGVQWLPNSYAFFWFTPNQESETELDTRTSPFVFPGTVNTPTLFKEDPEDPNSAGFYEQSSFHNGISYKLRIEFQSSTEFGRSAIRTLDYSQNSASIFAAIGLNFPLDNYFLHSGQTLMHWILLGNDFLRGEAADDSLYGFDGHDILYGNGGNDNLIGGRGSDYLYGGDGIDTAWFELDSSNYALSRSPTTGHIQVQPRVGSSFSEIDHLGSDIEFIGFPDRTVATNTLQYWGQSRVDDPASTNSPDRTPVYRFFNVRDNAFFFTTSESEKQLVIRNSADSNRENLNWPYVYQGARFKPAISYPNAVDLYRFYNYHTGHHFFTASETEKAYVLQNILEENWPFTYEGVAFKVYLTDPTPDSAELELPIHRFYSPSLDRHFFTALKSEYTELNSSTLWNYEGVGFYTESLYQ